MYSKVYLTPIDQETMDPTGKNRRSVESFKAQPPTPQREITKKLNRREWLDAYLTGFRPQLEKIPKHSRFIADDTGYIEKYRPQGGSFDFSVLMENLEQSYRNAEYRPIFKLIILGRDWLLRYTKQLCQRYGYPQDVYIPTYAANAAIPTGLKKGSFFAETCAMFPWRHCWPDLPGHRVARGKLRVIHQDSVNNVRYVEQSLMKIKRWYITYLPKIFSGWINPLKQMSLDMTNIVDRIGFINIETDFESMDTHFSLELAVELFLPLAELLLPEGEYLHFAQYVEEAFYQEEYLGNVMLTGKHNLFSGQPITNDIETYVSLMLMLGALLHNNVDPSKVLMQAVGDDSTLILPAQLVKKLSPDIAKKILDDIIEESNNLGLVMKREKCRFNTGDIKFCRRLWYAQAPRIPNPYGLGSTNGTIRGTYPYVLALNSIVNPEYPSNSVEESVIAALQITDNCYGNPLFSQFVQFVFSRLQYPVLDLTQDHISRVNARDWWERV